VDVASAGKGDTVSAGRGDAGCVTGEVTAGKGEAVSAGRGDAGCDVDVASASRGDAGCVTGEVSAGRGDVVSAGKGGATDVGDAVKGDCTCSVDWYGEGWYGGSVNWYGEGGSVDWYGSGGWFGVSDSSVSSFLNILIIFGSLILHNNKPPIVKIPTVE